MTSEQDVDEREAPESEPLLDVWLLRYPLRLGGRASEHYESVFREFALLSTADPGESVPGRMIALLDELGSRYARNNAHEQERDAALARGEEVLDVHLRVPASVAPVGLRVAEMLDETDEFCRQGVLLTLEPADDVVAFRRWYLGELVRQVAGEAPQPWPGEPT
jgi:hypothetical protein